MKEELYAWFQGIAYEEGSGPGKVFYFLHLKSKIDLTQ